MGEAKARIPGVEILAETNFPALIRFDCKFGEVWIAEEGCKLAINLVGLA